MNYKATIKRGEPMPSICEICTSVKRCKGEKRKIPQENECFVDYFESRKLPNNMSEEMKERLLEYTPFTNSKRKVKTVCGNFAHVRSIRYS